jgi:hypothetical protein
MRACGSDEIGDLARSASFWGPTLTSTVPVRVATILAPPLELLAFRLFSVAAPCPTPACLYACCVQGMQIRLSAGFVVRRSFRLWTLLCPHAERSSAESCPLAEAGFLRAWAFFSFFESLMHASAKEHCGRHRHTWPSYTRARRHPSFGHKGCRCGDSGHGVEGFHTQTDQQHMSQKGTSRLSVLAGDSLWRRGKPEPPCTLQWHHVSSFEGVLSKSLYCLPFGSPRRPARLASGRTSTFIAIITPRQTPNL